MIKEGRGKGEGAVYKPWLTVRDLPSLGRCSEIAGWKTTRIHHLLSKLETKYFYHLEWVDSIVDIREQYPLLDKFDSYEETMDIAKEIGVNYPIIPGTRTPNVMTTDFLLTVDINGEHFLKARTIKYSKDLNDKRTLEKLEVERIYWERRDIDWKIITEKQINESLAFNVEYIHKCRTLIGFDYITPGLIRKVNKALCDKSNSQELTLAELTKEVDNEFDLKAGASLLIVKHLIANKVWIIDITNRIDTAKPLIFSI
jgi:hypothetical protein